MSSILLLLVGVVVAAVQVILRLVVGVEPGDTVQVLDF
jgi:hypothetical protein